MQIGFNNDVPYRGKKFHIQTEDRGMESATIETQVFCGGAILDTAILSYQKFMDAEPDLERQKEKVRHLMQVASKKFYNKIHTGAYDSMVGLDVLADDEKIEVADFKPSQERIPQSALDLENDPEGFAIDPGFAGEHVDLSKLKEKLGASLSDAALATPKPLPKPMPKPVKTAPKPKPLPKPTRKIEEESEGMIEDSPTMMVSLEDIETTMVQDAATHAWREVNFPPTGTRAWRGCSAPRGDLSIAEMVEAFIGA